MRRTYENNLDLLYRAFDARGHDIAKRAAEFARFFHVGTRKDGVKPEFAHQVEIGLFLVEMEPLLPDPGHALAVAMLHDVTEDYDVSPQDLSVRFGAAVADSVWRLSKVYRGRPTKSTAAYFADLAEHPADAVVKGADRLHNLTDMEGVFDPDKQVRYMGQVDRHFLPMFNRAVVRDPAHAPALRYVESKLKRLCAYYRAQPEAGKGKPSVFNRKRLEMAL